MRPPEGTRRLPPAIQQTIGLRYEFLRGLRVRQVQRATLCDFSMCDFSTADLIRACYLHAQETTMKLTYYGHSCFAVEVSRKTLLFDPFITPNALARSVDAKKIPADYILLTHGHEDHVADAASIARRTGATIIANFEVATWFAKQGVQKTHGMNHGGAFSFDFGRVKYVNAIHSSSLPDGSYGGNPGGFVVQSAEGNFYHSGDTALTTDLKLIGEYGQLRFAALCIGDNFTMGIDDAITASEWIGCNEILGIHYDTFPPIRINHAEAIEKFRARGKRLHLLAPGAVARVLTCGSDRDRSLVAAGGMRENAREYSTACATGTCCAPGRRAVRFGPRREANDVTQTAGLLYRRRKSARLEQRRLPSAIRQMSHLRYESKDFPAAGVYLDRTQSIKYNYMIKRTLLFLTCISAVAWTAMAQPDYFYVSSTTFRTSAQSRQPKWQPNQN